MGDHHPVTGLGVRPRDIEIICTRDGHSYTVKDDGGARTRDGFISHPFRQSLLRKLAQVNADGSPVYVVKKPLEPLFDGDPVARFPVLNEATAAIIKANIKAREERLVNERARALETARAQGASDAVLSLVEVKVKEALAAKAPSKEPKDAKA